MKEIKIKSRERNYTVKFASVGEPEGLVITSQNVKDLYFKDKDFLTIAAVEKNKNYVYTGKVINMLLERNIHRSDTLTVIGGGVTQDICGFIASILFRGIDWVFYPTTLLSMVDSCIGSKTSINVGKYKNQIGTYYPPSQIVIDTNFLKTLPPDELKSGMGEAVKFHFVAGKVLDINTPVDKVIYDTLQIKKKYIEKDEFDCKSRLLLGFGHTFGHALESVSNYTVRHGQAVAWGCNLANYISLRMGMLSLKDYNQMGDQFSLYFPEFDFKKRHVTPFMEALGRDKKTTGELNCILSEGIGKMVKTEVPFEIVERFINEYYGYDSRPPRQQASQEQESSVTGG